MWYWTIPIVSINITSTYHTIVWYWRSYDALFIAAHRLRWYWQVYYSPSFARTCVANPGAWTATRGLRGVLRLLHVLCTSRRLSFVALVRGAFLTVSDQLRRYSPCPRGFLLLFVVVFTLNLSTQRHQQYPQCRSWFFILERYKLYVTGSETEKNQTLLKNQGRQIKC